jgi:hypothetical protein
VGIVGQDSLTEIAMPALKNKNALREFEEESDE